LNITLHPKYIVQTTLLLLGGDVINCTQLPQKATKALGYKKKASKDGGSSFDAFLNY
jgi:hypothetical protein